MTEEILLTPRELLYIAALLDAPAFIGLSDAFFGMDETEMRREITALRLSLLKKGYADMNFDGGFSLKTLVLETAGVGAACDTFIVADKNKAGAAPVRECYYAKRGRLIKIAERDGLKALTPIADLSRMFELMMNGVVWRDAGNSLKSIRLSNAVLKEARERLDGSGAADCRRVLLAAGCDEDAGSLIAAGLAGTADYYAAAVTAFTGERQGTESVMIIAAPNGIYKMTPMADTDAGAVQFDATTAEQAADAVKNMITAALRGETGDK